MTPANHDAIRRRIETLRHWRDKNDPDAQMMADLLEEIERMEGKATAPPENA